MKVCFALIITIIFSINVSEAQPSAGKKAELCQDIISSIETLIRTGLIMKHDKTWNNISVSKQWYQTPFDQKKNLLKATTTCLSKGGILSVTDGFSAKEVAAVGPFVGYKVYE